MSAGRLLSLISARSTPAITSDTVLPSKSRCPLSISQRMTPKAQMSVRLSTFWPRACSGDM